MQGSRHLLEAQSQPEESEPSAGELPAGRRRNRKVGKGHNAHEEMIISAYYLVVGKRLP